MDEDRTDERSSRMKLSMKGIAVGFAVGAFIGGASAVLAATGTSATPTPSAATTAPPPPFVAGMGHFGGPFAQGSVISTAASYLGLNQTELQTKLQTGKTLAQVAEAQGKSVSGLEDAMVAAAKTRLDANTALTADQKATILAQLKSNIDTMVNTTCPRVSGAGPAGRFGSGMGPMMGGIMGR
jgi:hypothetical protein